MPYTRFQILLDATVEQHFDLSSNSRLHAIDLAEWSNVKFARGSLKVLGLSMGSKSKVVVSP